MPLTTVDRDTADALCRAADFGRKEPVPTKGGIAITSHPLVSHMAAEAMRAGGNACDAALAAALAQTVIEPHMTTITGGLSMLYYDATADEVHLRERVRCRPQGDLPDFAVADLRTGKGVAVPGW